MAIELPEISALTPADVAAMDDEAFDLYLRTRPFQELWNALSPEQQTTLSMIRLGSDKDEAMAQMRGYVMMNVRAKAAQQIAEQVRAASGAIQEQGGSACE